MAWVTPEEALGITPGVAVSQELIDAAQIIVEIFADTTEEASDNGLISSTNLRYLKYAVAYQAAWMTAHPDAFTGSDFESFQSDGLQATRGSENDNLLAPMAKRCIKRLSWKRNRSLYLNPAFSRRSYMPRPEDSNNALLDDYRTDWRPLDC
jgi:hypothetical protein